MTTILIVDDDPDVREAIEDILNETDYDLLTAGGGQEAIDYIQQQAIDLIILDVIMPDIDGLTVCRRVRANPYSAHIPILFLTAKGRVQDIVKGLDVGGDDYLTKPFEILELPARIRALLRRTSNRTRKIKSEQLEVGVLKLYLNSHELVIENSERVALTGMEYHLLFHLMSNPNQPTSAEQLLIDVWEYPAGTGDPAIVHSHIHNLRKKLKPYSEQKLIHTVYRRGYMVKDT